MGGALRQKSDEVESHVSTKHEIVKIAGVSHDTVAKVKNLDFRMGARRPYVSPRFNNSGNFAILTAIRRASSEVRRFVLLRRPSSFSK